MIDILLRLFFLWKLFKKINIRFKLVYSLYIFTRCFIMALDNQMVFKYKSSTVIGQRCNIVPRETSFHVNWSHQRKLHNINEKLILQMLCYPEK